MGFSEKSFLSLNSQGYHRVTYSDWGEEDGNPVLCVHGLTGNGHDFDVLAEALVKDGHRVIAVDLPGRGRSDFLPNPLDYHYGQYWQDIMALLTHLDLAEPERVDYIGISLGGLLGFRLAGIKDTPIKRFICNDVGPEVPKDALDFIYQVIAQEYVFDTIEEMELRMRATRGLSWGPVTDEQWHEMAEHNARALPDGSLTYGYDPQIARIFESEPTGAIDLWPFFEAIECETLLIRGGQSLVLPEDITQKMRSLQPNMDFHQFDDCGHVPSLMAPEHIALISEWLG